MTHQPYMHKPDELMQVALASCQRTGCAQYCTGVDVRPVQLRSQTTGVNGPNKFEGPVVQMCAECRRCNRGCFKMVTP